MRTTLTLDEDVAEKLKELSAERGLSFKKLVNDLLRRGIHAPEKLQTPEPFVIRARPLKRQPGVELDNVAELLERIDGPAQK